MDINKLKGNIIGFFKYENDRLLDKSGNMIAPKWFLNIWKKGDACFMDDTEGLYIKTSCGFEIVPIGNYVIYDKYLNLYTCNSSVYEKLFADDN